MEHATALVTHDATPIPCTCGLICACQRLRAAGWQQVRCSACRCGIVTDGPERFAADLAAMSETLLEAADRMRHRQARWAERQVA